MPPKRTKGKTSQPTASPMRKKATAQLLRAQKDKEAKGEVVPVTPLNEDMSSPSERTSRSGRQGMSQRVARGPPVKQSPKGAFSLKGKSNATGIRASPLKQNRRMLVNKSPHKFPDTPRRPYRKAESPQESPTTVFKTVPVKSFYEVVKTKTFKDFDEDLVLAEPFLVERDGKLLRTNHLKEVEEQQKAIETLKKKVDKKSKELASLEKKNKDGQYQSKVDKLTSQLEPLMDRVELLQKEIDDMNVEAYYFPGGKPIQIAPAKSVPGLGEIITSRPHCLVPRAFFKHSARDKTRMQASHAARVLAGAYSGESWLDPK